MEEQLIDACKNGSSDEVRNLIQTNVNLNAKDIDGDTALICAAYYGHKACIKLLIDAGADLHVQNNGGDTALIFAAYKGYKDCIKLLIDAGADLDIQENDGKTAETVANEKHHTEIVRILREANSESHQPTFDQLRSQLSQLEEQKSREINHLQQVLNESLAQNSSLVAKLSERESQIAALDIESQIDNSRSINSCRELEYKLQELQMKLQRKKDTVQEDQDLSKLCCICLEKEKEIMILPCLHVVFCESCSGSYQDRLCPICRINIQGRGKPHY